MWTIVEKFGERVFQMRNLEKDWAICQDEFLEGIQHIVGKRGAILSFSIDPNLNNTNGSNTNSSSAASITSPSLMSSRRHSYIDYEIDSLRHDVDDLKDDNDKLRKELELTRNEAEEARVQLQVQLQQQQQKEKQQQQQQKSKSGHSKDLREGSDSELPTSFGKREVKDRTFINRARVLVILYLLAPLLMPIVLSSCYASVWVTLLSSMCCCGFKFGIQNHAGVVQRLVQKEKEVAQLRETIDKMEKKYKDKAELVTVSFPGPIQGFKNERDADGKELPTDF